MDSGELRKVFLDFFEKRGHKIVPSSSLLPSDPSVLFTTAGMQQFKPYFLGEKSSYGNRVCSCQKCFRTSDIESVGDASHLTFLEMLGNFSFGDYFKEEAIQFAYDFLFKELKLSLENAVFTIFEGNKEVPADRESSSIWKKLGVAEDKIKMCGREDNFWGPTGLEGPCGPTTEIHINGIEVWNLVFNEYYQDKDKKLTPLEQKGVDTGMGLERLAMTVQGKSNVFETDLFSSLITGIPGNDEKAKRIIADHIKGAVFLASEGILPSNVERGYILRRVLRRAIRYGKLIGLPGGFSRVLAEKAIKIYENVYPEIQSQKPDILAVIQKEEEKFEKTIEKAIKILNAEITLKKYTPGQPMIEDRISMEIDGMPGFTPHLLNGKWFFDLYQNFGFPFEMAIEELKSRGRNISEVEINRMKREFEDELKKHQEISRAGVEGKFGGGGEFSPELHTATHLLHAALRKVLGDKTQQMGSDITSQRLRFDFSHPQKMTVQELKEVEDLVNQKIKENLEIKREEMIFEKAIKSGALAFFKEKYPEIVSVYSVGNFSKEICAGPHAKRTGELGHFKIIKEESSGAGVRRIRAILE